MFMEQPKIPLLFMPVSYYSMPCAKRTFSRTIFDDPY